MKLLSTNSKIAIAIAIAAISGVVQADVQAAEDTLNLSAYSQTRAVGYGVSLEYANYTSVVATCEQTKYKSGDRVTTCKAVKAITQVNI